MNVRKWLFVAVGLLFDVRWMPLGKSLFSDITWFHLKWWLLVSFIAFSVFVLLAVMTENCVYCMSRRMGWGVPRKLARGELVCYRWMFSAAVLHYLVSAGLFRDGASLFLAWLHLLIWLSTEAVHLWAKGFPEKHAEL